MVVFGKKARALAEKVEAFERSLLLWAEQNKARIDKIDERADKLDAALAELTTTVKNITEDDSSKVTPQQIMQEWLLGDKGGK